MNRDIKTQFFIFILLFAFVLLVNHYIIAVNHIYQEQPEIYLANSQITSFHDFINLYLHPFMFNVFYIPFFRPSGHFLIYQVLAPLLGWHNNQAMLVVNFLFLALTGLYLIKLYQLLFPRMVMGAYIAFALYLMHPALILSRLIVLHFEFAYVLLTVMGTFYFVRWCQTNYATSSSQINKVTFTNFRGLIAAIFLYAFAITFKESAIMLGPVLAAYLCISLYSGQPLAQYARAVLANKQVRNILLLLTMISLILVTYITLQWPTLHNPAALDSNWQTTVSSAAELIKILLASPYNLLPDSIYSLYHSGWRDTIFPSVTRLIIWSCILMTIWSMWILKKSTDAEAQTYRNSLLFLFVSALIYLVLPIGWGMGLAWHLSLTLLCLSAIAGFGVEYLFQHFIHQTKWQMFSCGALALLIGLSTLLVNDENIAFALAKNKMDFTLMTNAVTNPPAIKNKLNNDSVIVVEDRTSDNGYPMGNYYPLSHLFTLGTYNINQMERTTSRSFFKFQSIYAGTLFRWVYLMPQLKEEVIPFQIDKMNKVPDIVLYNWLKHKNNIFCLGYDDAGRWSDKTDAFKMKLQQENARRKLTINDYQAEPNMKLPGRPTSQLTILLPEPSICQLQCDQSKQCRGFTYADVAYMGHHSRKCFYFSADNISAAKQPCSVCTTYLKRSS